MSAPPYMKLYWGDYSRKTRHLRTAAEHGAYLLLIAALWDAGGKIPADDGTLARHALCTADEWASLRDVIMPFFRVSRGALTHSRVTEELTKYADTSGKRKQAGKAGGKARAGKHREIPEANAKQTEGISTHNHNQNQNHIYSEDKSSASEPVEVDLDALAWKTAVQVLTEQGGCAEPEARRFFGKLLAAQKLLAKEMLPTLSSALVNRTQDPRAYITKAAVNVAKRRAEASAPAKRVSFV